MEGKKNRGFSGMIQDGLEYVSERIIASVSPPISESLERVMQNLEARILRMEERVLRKMFSFAFMGCGAVFLMGALFFSLREFFGWSNSAAFFSVGIVVFGIGALIRWESRS